MRAYRLSPVPDPDDITEMIFLASVHREPIISVAIELGVNVELVQHWVNKYEARDDAPEDCVIVIDLEEVRAAHHH